MIETGQGTNDRNRAKVWRRVGVRAAGTPPHEEEKYGF